MSKARERNKGLLMKCPYHVIARWLQVNQFYNGLNGMSRLILDALTRGSFSKNSDIKAYELFRRYGKK